MCGIAGVVRFSGPALPADGMRHLLRYLQHRGPDGEGVFTRERVTLGHRRLSIIDLEGGRQPMCNEDESVWITYNGELYNFAQLRAELIEAGHVFRSRCDTEVIIHAYEQWGPECVSRFRGMFAFGIADFRLRRLFVARDHLGIKPLFLRFGTDYMSPLPPRYLPFCIHSRNVRRFSPRPSISSCDTATFHIRIPPMTPSSSWHRPVFRSSSGTVTSELPSATGS
jgi:asparagine synthetase B (glutamine-hydrolysing)